jgi:hypothetical protein
VARRRRVVSVGRGRGGMRLRGAVSRERGRDACSRSCYVHGMNSQKVGAGAVLVIGALALACGGKALGTGGEGGGGGNGGGSGGGSGGTSMNQDGGSTTDSPEPADGACNAPLGANTCAPCPGDTLDGAAPNGTYHCGDDGVLPKCPSGAALDGVCASVGDISFNACILCLNSNLGYQLGCSPRRLQALRVKRKGRNLRPGETERWSREYFQNLGLHRLRGTVRYPEAA